MDRLRRQLILGCAVGWAGPARAADVKELPLDSGSSGVLEPNRSSRLVVQTHLTGIRTTVWVRRDGRVDPDMGSLTQHLYENSYGWKTTALKSTDSRRSVAMAWKCRCTRSARRFSTTPRIITKMVPAPRRMASTAKRSCCGTFDLLERRFIAERHCRHIESAAHGSAGRRIVAS